MATDLSSDIASAAVGPSSVTVDGVTMSAAGVESLIAADRYLASKAASKLKGRGLRFTQLRTPGAVTRNCLTQVDSFGRLL